MTKRKTTTTKRTITTDELIGEIVEVLAMGDGKFIEDIANRVIVPEVRYIGDSKGCAMFEQEMED